MNSLSNSSRVIFAILWVMWYGDIGNLCGVMLLGSRGVNFMSELSICARSLCVTLKKPSHRRGSHGPDWAWADAAWLKATQQKWVSETGKQHGPLITDILKESCCFFQYQFVNLNCPFSLYYCLSAVSFCLVIEELFVFSLCVKTDLN